MPDPRDHTAASRRIVSQGLEPPPGFVPRAEFLRMEALMIRWRIAAQRWTPGGSEYMDPAYCERFIQERREDAHNTKKEVTILRRRVAELEAQLAKQGRAA